MMVVFGALAYVLRRLDFPLAPRELGLVLGRMFDDFLRTALIISGGSWRRSGSGRSAWCCCSSWSASSC